MITKINEDKNVIIDINRYVILNYLYLDYPWVNIIGLSVPSQRLIKLEGNKRTCGAQWIDSLGSLLVFEPTAY